MNAHSRAFIPGLAASPLKIAVLALLLAFALTLAGCPLSPTQAEITITPSEETLEEGETLQLAATSTSAQDTAFTWSSSDEEVAEVDANSGLVTAIAPGTATLTATGNSSAASGSATITVIAAWTADSFTFDVTLASDTAMVDEEHLDLLVESDEENHIYTLDAAQAEALGLDLTVGNVLILHGVAVRRITSVEESADQLVVETEFVPLNEVIPNGTVAWDYGVEFTPEKVKSIEIPGVGVVYPKAGTPIEFSFKIGDYTYDVKVTLDNETSPFEFTITKDLGGSASAQCKAYGKIARFRSKDQIRFSEGQLTEFGHELNGMQGDLTLELVVAASGRDVVNLEFPATLMKIPFVVGFIPVELNIKIQFVINASVPADGSAMVSTDFSYNSDLGFSCNGVNVSAGGNLGGIEFGEGTHQTGASSGISVNFGMGFPRVELSILKDSVVPWAQTAFLIGGTYTPAFPACQTADALFLGAAGYSLGLFGLEFLSGSTTFFEEKRELLRTGDCPEDRKTDEAFDAESILSGGLPQGLLEEEAFPAPR